MACEHCVYWYVARANRPEPGRESADDVGQCRRFPVMTITKRVYTCGEVVINRDWWSGSQDLIGQAEERSRNLYSDYEREKAKRIALEKKLKAANAKLRAR